MKYKRINFSKNWNNKLICDIFSTIRPSYKEYITDEVFEIKISERHFCYAKVLKSFNLTLKEIVSSGIFLLDTGLNEKDFINLMSNMYSKKSWWKNENTEMKIVFLNKIQQLTIFEDGQYSNINN